MRGIKLLLPGLLIGLVIACGSDAVAAPTATNVPPTNVPPTFAPFVPPPTQTSVADVSPGAAELLGLESVRDFPEELKSDSPPLDREVAAEIARAFLSNTRVVGSPSITDFCSDGSGQILVTPNRDTDFDGAFFRWEVLPNPAGRWNQPRVLMYMDDFELATLLRAALGLAALTFTIDEEDIVKGDPGEAYDLPTCGQ